MNFELLLEQFRRRAKTKGQTGKDQNAARQRGGKRQRRSQFQSLEQRQLLAADVSLSSDTLVISETTNGGDHFVIETTSTEFVLSSDDTLTADGTITDTEADNEKVVVAKNTITGVRVLGNNGNNLITVKDFAGFDADLFGGNGTDVYKLEDDFGTTRIFDTDGGTVDLSEHTDPWAVSITAGQVTIDGDDRSQATFASGGGFTVSPSAITDGSAAVNLIDGLSELASLGDELTTHDKLNEPLVLLDNKSIGDYLPIGEIVQQHVVKPLQDYYDNPGASGLNLVGILESLSEVDGSSYTGDGQLTLNLNPSIQVDGDITELAFDIDATLLHQDVTLVLGEPVLSLNETLPTSLGASDLTGDLTTQFNWKFKAGIDSSDSSAFFVEFSDDLEVTAQVDETVTSLELNAGLLGLQTGANGPSSAPSTISLDLDTTISLTSLSALDGTNGGTTNSEVRIGELQNPNRLDLIATDASAKADVDINLYAIANGITGITDAESANIHWSDNVFDATEPVLIQNIATLEIDSFFNSDASTLYQLTQQFTTFLESLSAKTLDDTSVPLTATTSLADVFDFSEIYETEFVDQITLPQHESSALISSVVDGEPLGTSGNTNPDITVQLSNGTTYDVDLDAGSPQTLGAVIGLIVSTVNDAEKLTLIETSGQPLTLADRTEGIGSFTITAKTLGGEPYAAASNLSLDADAVKQDIEGTDKTEQTIEVAPVKGPAFSSIQTLASLANAGTNTTLDGLSFDREADAGPTLSFNVKIMQDGEVTNDDLSLIDFGALTGIELSAGKVDLVTPKVEFNLPFEILLTPVGGDVSSTTLLADLNAGDGVNVFEGGDDLRIHTADGTSFTVELDAGLASETLIDLGISNGSGNELSISLRSGDTIEIDLADNLTSSGSPAANLGELFELINQQATAAGIEETQFEATVDVARGGLRFIDYTEGSSTFSITGTAATALSLGTSSITEIDGIDVALIATSTVTLDDLVQKLRSAASDAGLTLPTDGDPTEAWDFDVQYTGPGIEFVDRTTLASAITGTAEVTSEMDQLKSTGSFTANVLVGREVQIVSGTGSEQTLTIIANTADVLTVEADWTIAPDETSQFQIDNGLFIGKLNGTGAGVSLGISGSQILQSVNADTPLFDGRTGIFVGTSHSAAADIQISFADGRGTFNVDLDVGSPSTLAGITAAIEAEMVPGLRVFTDGGGNISLIDDRADGSALDAAGFKIVDINGSTAATDLGLTADAVVADVDYAKGGAEETAIGIVGSARLLGGAPLDGDTPSSRMSITQGTESHIAISMGINETAAGEGVALYGPLEVSVSNSVVDNANFTADLTLRERTFRQLNEGLFNPYVMLLQDGEVDFKSGFDLSLDLAVNPETAINNVSGITGFDVAVTNVFDVLAGDETVTPSLPGDTSVRSLLQSIENISIDDLLSGLQSTSDYLFSLQTQSSLAETLPGLPQGIGSIFGFGENFEARVDQIRSNPPTTIQQFNAALADASAPAKAALSGQLTPTLGFDKTNETLTLDLNYVLDAVDESLPLTLNLTDLGVNLGDLGLQQVAAIVDSTGESLLDVSANGTVNVKLGFELSDAASPVISILSGGDASTFGIQATSVDSMNFPAVFGSLPVDVLRGSYALGKDPEAAMLEDATYTLSLDSDVDVSSVSFSDAASSGTTASIVGVAKANFDLLLPESVIPANAPSESPYINVSVPTVGAPTTGSTIETNLSGRSNEWEKFSDLSANFSLTDSMEGFKLGVQQLFNGLDEVFDTALLSQNLPLVGQQLGEAVTFLNDIGDSVFNNLDALPRAGITSDSVKQALYDALGPGGFNWLQDSTGADNPDTEVNIDDIKLVVETVTTASGRELVTGVEYQMNLVMSPQRLQFPVDLDLLLPGLGLDIEAQADVLFGFDMPLNIGVSVSDGVYLDVGSTDDVNISLDISLPNNVAQISGSPSLTFANTDATDPTITRDSGNWILDNFVVGQIIQVDGSDLPANNDGRFWITAINDDGTELTLSATDNDLNATTVEADQILPEGPTAGITVSVSEVSMTGGSSLTFNDSDKTVTRSSGSWIEDGFGVGDDLIVSGSGDGSGTHVIAAINPNGLTVTLEEATGNATLTNRIVTSGRAHGIDATMGVLPFRVWDATPDQSEFVADVAFNLHDAGSTNGTRLSVNDLVAQPEFPILPRSGFSEAPISDIVTFSAATSGSVELNDISIEIETNLPRSAAFPPYRATLEINDWNWQIEDSLISQLPVPGSIEFDQVQFDLVGFVRDFVGPTLTRFRTALTPFDDRLDFLTSEAVPILSDLFGRTSYASAPGTFGGRTDAGDFAGAADVIRKLVDGGTPSHTGFKALLEHTAFGDSNASLAPILGLTGRQWIDIGSFNVDAAVAVNVAGNPETIFDESAFDERGFGSFDDAPQRLTNSPDLVFDVSSNTIERKNFELSDVTFNYSFVVVGHQLTATSNLESLGFRQGDYITFDGITGFDANFNGTYELLDVSGSTALVTLPNSAPLAGTFTAPRVIGNGATWDTDGFTELSSIRIDGGLNEGTYTVGSVTPTKLILSGLKADETFEKSAGIDIRVSTSSGGGSYSGSIAGQISGVLNDRFSSAQQSAISFYATQALPGRGAGFGVSLLGGVVQKALSPLDGNLTGFDPIEFPILSESFGLLVGDTTFGTKTAEESQLLHYSTPELALTLYQDFPANKKTFFCELPFGSAFASSGVCDVLTQNVTPFVSIAFEARMDFGIGFDTTGLEIYRDSGNPEAIIEGFYFDDTDGVNPNPSLIGGNESGPVGTNYGVRDLTQSRILGGIGAGVFRKFGSALGNLKAGVELSFYTGQDLNFHDPNSDGRIRSSEFDVLASYQTDHVNNSFSYSDAKNAFDESIRIEVRGDAFVKIKALFITVIDVRVNIFTFGFNVPLDNVSFSEPVLATLNSGVLTLNLGGNATDRNYRTGETDEVIYVGYNPNTDRFVVSGFGSQNQSFVASQVISISASAGSGDDQIYIQSLVTKPVTIDGGDGNDILIGGDGNDTLTGSGGNDVIHGGGGADQIYGDDQAGLVSGDDVIFGGDGNDEIWGGAGRDIIRGLRDDDEIHGEDGIDIIDGGQGNDSISGGGDGDRLFGGIGLDTIDGGAGNDHLEGGFGADVISGGSDDDEIYGGLGNDTINGGAGDDNLYGQQHNDTLDGGVGIDVLDGGLASDTVRGGDGDDRIRSSDGNDILDGQEGSDTYRLFFASGKLESLIQIIDSGSATDVDIFVATGTLDDDRFLLRSSVSGTDAFVGLLSDPDHDVTDPGYNPSVQRINYIDLERVTVEGSLGDDHFAADDTAAQVTLNGGAGDDVFQIGQLFRSQRTLIDANVAVNDIFATIETTRGFLSNGISQPMVVNGGLGSDTFTVFHNKAVLTLNGNEGDDNFEVRAFALVGSREPERARTDISGGAGADLVQYAVNAPVNIDGGDGFDTLTVIGTEFGDDFVITDAGVFGAGLTIDFTNIESLRVDAAEGNDRFYIESTGVEFLTELFGGLGDDTFNLSGDTPPVISNDLKGHSGIVNNDVTFSSDMRYSDLKVYGVSANVGDNEEPFVVIRSNGGSNIISESGTFDASTSDFYEIVLSQAPLLGFDVFIQALAPLPSAEQIALGGRAFRLESDETDADNKADGSSVTLKFTQDNWMIPQRVNIIADDAVLDDTGRLFTSEQLGVSQSFSFNDSALEGKRTAVINHLVVSSAATISGNALAIQASPTITIDTDMPFYEFIGETITVTSQDGKIVQERTITAAELVDGNMQLTVDRSWLAGEGLPDTTSTYSVNVADTTEMGNPESIVNTTFTVSDPTNVAIPAIDNPQDFLGRQITIVQGTGTGQSRFITGTNGVVDFSDSFEDIFTPNIHHSTLSLTSGDAVTATSGGTLNIRARGDFDLSSETLTVKLDGTTIDVLFDDNSGRQYVPLSASIPLSAGQLEAALVNGAMQLEFSVSNNVNDLERFYGASSLSFDLQFNVDANSATFNNGALGDLQFTLDRGWDATASPDVNSKYEIQIDDSLVGRVSSFDETPSGLVADDVFPADSDTRSLLVDNDSSFMQSQFGAEYLRGATIEIIGGPGAGQQRLILEVLDDNTLLLNGGWRTDLSDGESIYRIARFDGLAVSSLSVEINDNDQAGLIVDETKGFDSSSTDSVSGLVDDIDTITAVIEGGDGDQRGEREVVRVKLARQPSSDVTVELKFAETQLSIETLSGIAISGNELTFTTANWNEYQDVVVIATADLRREGFHTSQIKLETKSVDVDEMLSVTDSFTIDASAAVKLVGLSQFPSDNVSVSYNGQLLEVLDVSAPTGTAAKPSYLIIGNQVVFYDGINPTAISGSALDVAYDYVNPGYQDTFTKPVLVRISDTDAPSVLVRESGGSTDVVEGAQIFKQIEFTGERFDTDSLIGKTVSITSGTFTGQTATVIANTATSIRLDKSFTDDPEAGSTLEIESNDPSNPFEVDVVSVRDHSYQNDYYEVVLTAAPIDDLSTGRSAVEITLTPEDTKTSRTGGLVTLEKQVSIYQYDDFDSARVQRDPNNSDNLIVTFDETNWDQPVRIGVRAIDDLLVDGGDTKVFANGPNTVSEILGPVIVDGAGGDGSLAGLGAPEILPQETNVKAKTGDVEKVNDLDVTLAILDADELAELGLAGDLSNVEELVGSTLEVVATKPTDAWLAQFPSATVGSPRDPVVGQFRLITAASMVDGKVVVTLNERFGITGIDATVAAVNVGSFGFPTTSEVEIELSRSQRFDLGLGDIGDLAGRTLELTDGTGAVIRESVITGASEDDNGLATITVNADWSDSLSMEFGFVIQSEDLIQSYAITSESLNFFVDEDESVDYLFVHDEDSPADSDATDPDDRSTGYLTANRLWGLNTGFDVVIGGQLQAGGVRYGNLEVLQVDLGYGNNDFQVLGTHSRPDDADTTEDESFQTWTIVNGGNDILWPASGRQGDHIEITLNAADITVATGTAQSGSDNATIDSFSTFVVSTGTFDTDNSLAGFQITTVNDNGTEQTRTILGNTGDTVFIEGNWSELPVAGDAYTIVNLADGDISINGQGGDDVIDASQSTLGIVATGGLGMDTLTGGQGDDILFGDRGRVDYYGDDNGFGNFPIVTRLGYALDPIDGMATGDFSNSSIVVDSSKNYPVNDGFDNGLAGLYVDINNGTGALQTPRLIVGNTATALNVAPGFNQMLDATSTFRISTFPENQTDGVQRGANLLITVDDLMGDNDVISGGVGDDQIFGGAGDDDIDGEAGNDVILGDTGVIDRAATVSDSIKNVVDSLIESVRTKSPENGGEDLISGADDDDIIFGGFGTDYVNFGRDEVALVGEAGNDLILGDGGYASFDVTNGIAILVEVATNEPANGSTDFITAGVGEKTIFGGAGDDTLLAGADDAPDIVIGDEGIATFDSVTGLRERIASTTPSVGGTDTISGGDALNILLGGSGGDIIDGGDEQDVIFGDNGEVLFDALGVTQHILTTDPTFGGVDTIHGHGGNDIVIGGADGDTIHGGDDHDSILGDHGEVDFTRPVDRNVISRFIELADGGGNDVINGDAGDDFIWGGQGDDIISGGVGQDDLVGGHNVPFGSDSADLINGNENEDVILGDNGLISRELLSTELGTWTTYLAPFASIVVRTVQPFDDLDLVGGSDRLFGDDAMDIVVGQRGDDEIHGGEDDDELIGGLGSDTIFGDAGQDFILADAGQILRDFNDDGTPQLNSDGTWHRDLVTERIARVTDVIAMGPTGLIDAPADLAERLADADQVILASANLPNGAASVDSQGYSQTVAILLDVEPAYDDFVDGGEGNDVVLGQHGDDVIEGGSGDDILIGDHGVNVAPLETDLPQIVDATRLIGSDDGHDELSGIKLDLPGLGHVLVPDFVAEPGELVAERPRWDRVTQVNEVISDLANNDRIATTDSLSLSPAIMLTPHFIGHEDVLDGNDTISGGEGDDLLIGDQLIVNSELNSGIAPIYEATRTVESTIAGVMNAFESLTLDLGIVRHSIGGLPVGNRDVEIGNDDITGDGGEDTLIGDNAVFELPSTQEIPGSGTVEENAASLLDKLEIYRTIGDDAIQLVSRGQLSVVDVLLADAQSARPSLPAVSGSSLEFVQHHQLILSGDFLSGGDGADTVLGDDATLIAPFVTGTDGDLPDSAGAVGLNAETLKDLEEALYEDIRVNDADLQRRRESRVINVTEELSRRTPLNRIAYVPSADRNLGNDEIVGGDDGDVLIGDRGILVTPLIQNTPQTDLEFRDLDQHIESILNDVTQRDNEDLAESFELSVGRVAQSLSTTDAMSPASRHNAIAGEWSIGNDSIDGDGGDDIVLGDHGSLVAGITLADPEDYGSLRRSDYHLEALDDSMRRFLETSALNRVDVTRQEDGIAGGDGDDILMGAGGADSIRGNDGNDTIRGGTEANTLQGDAGTNFVRSNGGNYPDLDLQQTLGQFWFDQMNTPTRQLFLDAGAGAQMPVSWTVNGDGNTVDPGNGDPDNPIIPEVRTVTLTGDENAVTGQPLTYTASIDLLPTDATALYLWEVLDADGNAVSVSVGSEFVFRPAVTGTFTVNVMTSDSANGAGVATLTVVITDSRLTADPDQPGKFILTVGGTEGDDDIRLLDVRNQPNSVELRQRVGRERATRTLYTDISRVEIYGGEGEDSLSADRRLLIPVRLYGGAGDDELRGGAGNDYLDGGAGNDSIDGELGNDVIIGGFAADRLDGGGGEDLLIADSISGIAADEFLARWSNSSLSAADRMASLISDLTAATTPDGAVDDSDGDAGTDWFFGQTIDQIHARRGELDLLTEY